MFYEFFCSFRVELLVINHSVLDNSEVLLILFWKTDFLFFLQRVIYVFVLDILIFDFDHILFIFVDYSEQFSFYFCEVLSHIILAQEVHFFLYYQIWV
jgi:hypothetical protein